MKMIKYIVSLMLMASMSSCTDWLTIFPENEQTTDQYWRTKEEVEAVLGAGYVRLREANESLFTWGEARGNGIDFSLLPSSKSDIRKFREMDIIPENSFVKWDKLYSSIGMANSVIKYGPSVVGRDESFNVNVMNSMLSEAYFLRSLCYFYLVRSFRDVPYVTEPYVTDASSFDVPQSSEEEILNAILKDLEVAFESAKEFFPEADLTNPMNTKGRATKWSIAALMADIYLWRSAPGDYEKCLEMSNVIIESQRVGLITGDHWFKNFFPGNSNESIFEIQYSYAHAQTNAFLTWFLTGRYYVPSEFSIQLLMEEGDVRGEKGTYSQDFMLWKYIGTDPATTRNTSNQNDQNWLVYRLAEIYLMKAEACILLGQHAKATEYINLVRERAGVARISESSEQLVMIQYLLNERQREFVGEGKSWFDILRIGRRDNYKYKTLMVDNILTVVSPSQQAIVRSKLVDNNSHYLPIHADEIQTNKLLQQNPYYQSLGN